MGHTVDTGAQNPNLLPRGIETTSASRKQTVLMPAFGMDINDIIPVVTDGLPIRLLE